MLTKTVSYTDYNGNHRTETVHFNLTQAEVLEMEMRENLKGGLAEQLKAIVASNDGNRIMDFFQDFIRKSYGVKSDDGRSFRKSEDIANDFLGSEAYSEVFLELITDPDAAAAFIDAIVPKGLDKVADKIAKTRPQDHKKSAREQNQENLTGGNQEVPLTRAAAKAAQQDQQ